MGPPPPPESLGARFLGFCFLPWVLSFLDPIRSGERLLWRRQRSLEVAWIEPAARSKSVPVACPMVDLLDLGGRMSPDACLVARCVLRIQKGKAGIRVGMKDILLMDEPVNRCLAPGRTGSPTLTPC